MRLQTRTGIWLFAGGITLAACAIVATTVMALYPVEEWRWELSLGLTLTTGICLPITSYVGHKIRENSLLSDELQRLLDRDRLTDAATRDFFFARMADDPDAYGVALMVDIDHFKQVNDTHGHLAGDRVIAEVARLLRGHVRKEDIVCRFGGEEFVVFLQERDLDEGFAAAERMREVVQDHALDHGDAALSVTVSIGGSLKERARDVTHSIQVADAALYRAKALGRNRTVFGPPDLQVADHGRTIALRA